MPSDIRAVTLRFPVRGLYKRLAVQSQGPYTTPDAQNVRPDDVLDGRERGGTRAGLTKAFSQQLGSGNPIRLLTDIRYLSSGTVQSRVVASSNGTLYREQPAGTMVAVSATPTLKSDRMLLSADHQQKLFIADYENAYVTSQTDGVVNGSQQLTSSGAGDFAALGVTAGDYVVVITDDGTGDNEVQTLTCSGTPTGGTFVLSYGNESTPPIDYDASAATVQAKLTALTTIGSGNVSCSGGAFPGTAITVTFQSALANTDVSLIEADFRELTGGTNPSISVTETTKGGGATVGTYAISSVSTTTITLASDPGNATGVSFEIWRAPKVFDPTVPSLAVWLATDGQVPSGCQIITRFLDRIVLASGHQWYMSRQGDPYDWDYSQEDVGAAVSATNSEAGELGERITALAPHSDHCMVMWGSNSTWIMRGDPTGGGRIDNLSSIIGCLGPRAWCHHPHGLLFFLSYDGLYVMPAGCGAGEPTPVSREIIPGELLNIDTSSKTVLMDYDVRDRGIHLFICDSSGPDTHWWIDTSLADGQWQAAFFPVVMPATQEPFAICSRRNYASSQSVCLLGSRDGYIRSFSNAVSTDDGTAIASYVVYGPFMLGGNSGYLEGFIEEIRCTLDASSGSVDWELRTDGTAEGSLTANIAAKGTWRAGENPVVRPIARGAWATLKLTSSSGQWAMESLNLKLLQGRERRL